LPKIIFTIFYAVLFAVPEEIIFRGLVQGTLATIIENTAITVIISSLIFGLAHLPNGANSLHLKDWNWKFCIIACLAGLPLGIAFAITGSLFIPTLLHVLFLIMFILIIRSSDKLLQQDIKLT
jgi:membrane protease YdiL (CAAX protease family)